MNLRDFDKIERKLGMETRDSAHHHAWLVHNGVTVATTKRSHGNNKFLPEDLIRKQLHLNRDQFAGLISCVVSRMTTLRFSPKRESSAKVHNPRNLRNLPLPRNSSQSLRLFVELLVSLVEDAYL
jgi:hypothetical protein